MAQRKHTCLSLIVTETLEQWQASIEHGDIPSQRRFARALGAFACTDAAPCGRSVVETLTRRIARSQTEAVSTGSLQGLTVMAASAQDKTSYMAAVINGLNCPVGWITARAAVLAVTLLRDDSAKGSELFFALSRLWNELETEKSVLLVEELVSAPHHAGRLLHFLQSPPDDYAPAFTAALVVRGLSLIRSAKNAPEISSLLLRGIMHPCWLVGQLSAEGIVERGEADHFRTRLVALMHGSDSVAAGRAIFGLARLAAARRCAEPELAAALRSADVRLRMSAVAAAGQTLGASPAAALCNGLDYLMQTDPLVSPLARRAKNRLRVERSRSVSLTEMVLESMSPFAHVLTYETARLGSHSATEEVAAKHEEMLAVILLLEPGDGSETARQRIHKSISDYAAQTASAYSCMIQDSCVVAVFGESAATGESSLASALQGLEWLGKYALDALAAAKVTLHGDQIGLKQRGGLWELAGSGWELAQALHRFNDMGSILVSAALLPPLPQGHPLRLMLHWQGYRRLPEFGQIALSTYHNPSSGVGSSKLPAILRTQPVVTAPRRFQMPRTRYLALAILAASGLCFYEKHPEQVTGMLDAAHRWFDTLRTPQRPSPPFNPPVRSKANDSFDTNTMPSSNKGYTGKPHGGKSKQKNKKGAGSTNSSAASEPKEYQHPSLSVLYANTPLSPIADSQNIAALEESKDCPENSFVIVTLTVPFNSKQPARVFFSPKNCYGDIADFALEREGYALQDQRVTAKFHVEKHCFQFNIEYADEDGNRHPFGAFTYLLPFSRNSSSVAESETGQSPVP